jgi:phosphoribosylanthranilate isomerase
VTLIKICGIKTSEHALAAAAAKADLVGVVFAPSRRQISLEQAAEIRAALNTVKRRPKLAGLFVNATAAQIYAAITQSGLDYVQLSGDEPVHILEELPLVPILKSVRLHGAFEEQGWLDQAQSDDRVRLLIDAHVVGSYGGTGEVADWARAAELAQRLPIMLAGGLNSENVVSAIRTVQPWAVDVSSGVETAGVKDVAKIQAFITVARTYSHLVTNNR